MNVRTHEHGRFYTGPNGNLHFAGSASGVYLVDTVRSELSLPDRRDGGILEAFFSRTDELQAGSTSAAGGPYEPHILSASDFLLEAELRARFSQYFALWHPLFPFLDGAHIKQGFEQALASAKVHNILSGSSPSAAAYGKNVFEGMSVEHALVFTAILRSISTIGTRCGIMPGEEPVRGVPSFQSSSQVTLLGRLILDACEESRLSDALAVQGLLALLLTLYVSRKMRPASHLCATVIKLSYEAGLHRCPARYPQTFKTSAERDLRKRTFYSIYVLDRLLSLEFGVPPIFRDDDIDVCLLGDPEIHGLPPTASPSPNIRKSTLDGRPQAVREDFISSDRKRKRDEEAEAGRHVVVPARTEAVHPSNPQEGTHDAPSRPSTAASRGTPQAEPGAQASKAQARLWPAHSLARLANLMGRIMETFNKSRRWRVADPQDALTLRTDLDEWWNSLGVDSDVAENERSLSDPRRKYVPLLACLYHQQLFHLYRHSLSLPPSTVQHRHALQSAIIAARTVCSTLSKQVRRERDEVMWPGYVDMVFFASLIMAYGSKREAAGRWASNRLERDLDRAGDILQRLNQRWSSIRPLVQAVRGLGKPNTTDHDVAMNETDAGICFGFNLEANPLGPGMPLDGYGTDPYSADLDFWSLLDLSSYPTWTAPVPQPPQS